jgi:pentapeptide MXKDX repeat protein
MNKAICRLMAMCLLSASLAGFAQSSDSMKQDQGHPDQTKQDNGMKKDDSMKHDQMKDSKKAKKAKKTKNSGDSMKKDNSMKHDDQMKSSTPNQN